MCNIEWLHPSVIYLHACPTGEDNTLNTGTPRGRQFVHSRFEASAAVTQYDCRNAARYIRIISMEILLQNAVVR